MVQHQLTVFNYATGVSLLYLPAGIRTLSVFVLGFRGALAVFAGSLLTMVFEFPSLQPSTNEMLWSFGIAAASAFSAYLAMRAVQYWKNIPSSLEGLSMSDVVYIVISQGLVSSTLHQLLFHSGGISAEYIDDSNQQALVYWGAMASGDIVGSMLVLLSVLIVFHMLAKQQ